jgi:2,4-dienoyl-CoA reductase-like NADH-dependent reductase (Old Yellow Enzyme family)
VIKKTYPNLVVGTVGLITDPHQAESYLSSGRADVVLLARELLRNPHWAMTAASELGVAVKPANQYDRAWVSMLVPAKKGETEKRQGPRAATQVA